MIKKTGLIALIGALTLFMPANAKAFDGSVNGTYYIQNPDGNGAYVFQTGDEESVQMDDVFISGPEIAPAQIDAEESQDPVINIDNMILSAHESRRLYVKNFPGKVKWSSSDKYVCTVSSLGVVRGKHAGTAVITGKVKGGKTYTCSVEVLPFISNAEMGSIGVILSHHSALYDINSVKLTKINIGNYKHGGWWGNEHFDYQIFYTAKSKTGGTEKMTTVYNSSSGYFVYMVDRSEKYGTNTRTFTSEELARTQELFQAALEGKYVAKADTSLHLSSNNITLRQGKDFDLEVINTGKKPKWSSSDDKVASIKDGTLTANGLGTAVITAKIDTRELECIVNVVDEKYTDEEMAIFMELGQGHRTTENPESFVVESIDKGKWTNSFTGAMVHNITAFARAFVTFNNSDGVKQRVEVIIGYNNINNGYKYTYFGWNVTSGPSGISGTKTGSYDAEFVNDLNTMLQSGILDGDVVTE